MNGYKYILFPNYYLMENKFRAKNTAQKNDSKRTQMSPENQGAKPTTSKKKQKKAAQKKFSTEEILEKINYSFSRDAVWFKKTLETIDKVKAELDQVC